MKPTSPGFKTMAIRPTVCDLAWAKGIVPTPQGDVAVSWKWAADVLQLDVTIPEGTEADVILPAKTVHMKAGKQSFESPYKRAVQAVAEEAVVPQAHAAADTGGVSDANVVKDDLVHRFLARVEDHASHAGGGSNASAVINGTTLNGSGGTGSTDDGKTFRGYAGGDSLTLYFKQPCDVTEIRTFAGHADSRASQAYTVLAAYSTAPDKFVKIGTGSKSSSGGATEVRVAMKETGVVAVRFEFQNGPKGFNVYREFNVIGQPTK